MVESRRIHSLHHKTTIKEALIEFTEGAGMVMTQNVKMTGTELKVVGCQLS